jgi:GST-like protein
MQPVHFDLFGARTGNCLRVAIAFEEAQLPYKVSKVDLRHAEHHAQDFLALNPAGKVPVIVEHGSGDEQKPRVLTQSNAILLHIADRVPGTLLPLESSAQRPIAYERFFYFLTEAIGPSHAGFWLRSQEYGLAAKRELDARVMHAIAAAERFASQTEFLGGDRFGLADIAAVTIIGTYEREIAWPSLPALRRWYETAISRPSVQRGMHAFDA